MSDRPDDNAWLGTLVTVDATDPGGDPYSFGGPGGGMAAFLVEIDGDDGAPRPTPDSIGRFEPRNWRLSHLFDPDPEGRNDRRMEIQLVVDHQAPYEDGTAPFNQPEFFDSENRSSRMVDSAGRVALRTSHERIVDSEDQRYAVSLTLREIDVGDAAEDFPVNQDSPSVGGFPVPEGVQFREAGSTGGITTTRPSVSIGGVTFFGGAAINAAQQAIALGGSAVEIARAASTAAMGGQAILPEPKQQTRTRPLDDTPPPDRNPQGAYDVANIPAGYVTDEQALRIGLLGTFFTPNGAAGSYTVGREGTPIGPLPARHDAQFHMGPERTGRIMFVGNDAQRVEKGEKPFKGAMWWDPSRANIDTNVGLETGQWRPVVWVSANLPPSSPPPREERPPPGGGGGGGGSRPPKEEEEEDPKGPPTGAPPPFQPFPPEPISKPVKPKDPKDPEEPEETPLEDPQGPRNQCKMETGKNSGKSYTPGFPPETRDPNAPGQPYGTPEPGVSVPNPTSQARIYTRRGVPCMNVPAGRPTPDGGRDEHGHPPVDPVEGGIAIGGRLGLDDLLDFFAPRVGPPGQAAGDTPQVGTANEPAPFGEDIEGETRPAPIEPGLPNQGPGARQAPEPEDRENEPRGGGGAVAAGPGDKAPSPEQRRIIVGIQGNGKYKGFEFVEQPPRVRSKKAVIERDKQRKQIAEEEIRGLEEERDRKIKNINERNDLTDRQKQRAADRVRRKYDKRIQKGKRYVEKVQARIDKNQERVDELEAWRKSDSAHPLVKYPKAAKQPVAHTAGHLAASGPSDPAGAKQGAYIIDTTDPDFAVTSASNLGLEEVKSLVPSENIINVTESIRFDSEGRLINKR